MRKKELTFQQRVLVVIIYIVTFLYTCYYFSGSWEFLLNTASNYNILFISSALLLIFGTYITEPYFTKPIDIITNSTAIVLALLAINNPDQFAGYWVLFYSSISLGLISIVLILTSQIFKEDKYQKIFLTLVTKLGNSKLVFSLMYLATVYSYFRNQPIEFIFFVTFWIILVTEYVIREVVIFISWVIEVLLNITDKKRVIGEAIGCENPYLYSMEVDYKKHFQSNIKKGDLVCLELEKNIGAVGIIVNIKQLLNKRWLSVYLLSHKNAYLTINLKTNELIEVSKTIYSKDNSIYTLDIEEIKNDEQKKIIEENFLYKNHRNFVGYVTIGSDIAKIKFLSILDDSNEKFNLLREGCIIKTEIHNQNVLYQIIDATTDEKELERHNTYGYLIGIAHKIGYYDLAKKELNTVRWLPSIYSPVFFEENTATVKSELSIGVLPETNLEILLKDINTVVTHNTAILGILGIGKSRLTFELIQKIINNIPDIKIICIDITNEYVINLKNYIDESLVQIELNKSVIDNLRNQNKNGNADDPTSWGNEKLYEKILKDEFQAFSNNTDKKVLVINPDWHPVSKAGSDYKIAYKLDLSLAEKTRIISERLFMLAKDKWDKSTTEESRKVKARYLLVFEEAHSLIPEFNSTANKGDQNASNGTAKVILQGRKYGLGSLVVTQRTANISKSILNQCNTIFAMRTFDDTGKQFLENYIGTNYSNTLPTLEERQAIIVGKAVKLKQPVIVQLNHFKDIIITKNDIPTDDNKEASS